MPLEGNTQKLESDRRLKCSWYALSLDAVGWLEEERTFCSFSFTLPTLLGCPVLISQVIINKILPTLKSLAMKNEESP